MNEKSKTQTMAGKGVMQEIKALLKEFFVGEISDESYGLNLILSDGKIFYICAEKVN